MRPLPMLALFALLSLGGLAAGESAGHPPPQSTTEQLGRWFDRGVERVASVASDLWEAGKAAFDAGARTLRQREAARDTAAGK